MPDNNSRIRITSPDQFRSTPWKNGKGETLELAINEGGTLDRFDWRISIASVVEDGLFSDFTGYDRNMVLLEGAGMELVHDGTERQLLARPFDSVRFDGASVTSANLVDGPIRDFNLVARKDRYLSRLETHRRLNDAFVEQGDYVFVYSPTSAITFRDDQSGKTTILAPGHLLTLHDPLLRVVIVDGVDVIIGQIRAGV